MADAPNAQISTHFIENVDIDVSACRSALREESPFACHRFKSGNGFAILIRAYVPPSKLETDTDAYYKTTLLFRIKPSPNQKFDLPNKDVLAFMSAGSSSFPERTGCHGEGASGEIELHERTDNVLEVTYNIKFRMRSVDGRPNECLENDIVSRKFEATRIRFDDLNPWLGLKTPSSDPWNESHPETHP